MAALFCGLNSASLVKRYFFTSYIVQNSLVCQIFYTWLRTLWKLCVESGKKVYRRPVKNEKLSIYNYPNYFSKRLHGIQAMYTKYQKLNIILAIFDQGTMA